MLMSRKNIKTFKIVKRKDYLLQQILEQSQKASNYITLQENSLVSE